jgi:hypothetical protein
VYKQTLDYTAEDFSFRVNTNLQSAFHLSQLAHPLLKASGAGRIVFVSSICSVVSVNIGYPIYLAAERYSILLQEFACLVKSCSKCCNLFMIKKKKKKLRGEFIDSQGTWHANWLKTI